MNVQSDKVLQDSKQRSNEINKSSKNNEITTGGKIAWLHYREVGLFDE